MKKPARTNKLTVKGIRVAKEILTKRFAPCDLAACRHACCRDGALVGTGRINKIKKILPELFTKMRPEAVEMVKKRGFHRESLYNRSDMDQSHDHHYLRTVKGRCVFLTYDDSGGCVLQKYCKKHKLGFELKPPGCWSFPIDLIGDRLVIYRWDTLPCLNNTRNKKSPPIYLSCKKELSDFLGEDGYRELLKKIAEQSAF